MSKQVTVEHELGCGTAVVLIALILVAVAHCKGCTINIDARNRTIPTVRTAN